MLRYISLRLLQSVGVLFIVITITFFLVRLAPGDPFSSEREMPEFVREQLMSYYGFDDPILVQYASYLGNLLQGDFGPSYTSPRTVNEIIAQSFPVSLGLGLAALALALCIGVPLGIAAALKANTKVDYTAMSFAMIGICMPTFVMGPVLALVLGVGLGWFPVSGFFGPSYWFLPTLTLGLVYAAIFARVTRGGMMEILQQNFLTTARAKGLPSWTILWKHSLRGGLLPLVSLLGPAFAGIISGSFVVETIFRVPGLGRYFVQSALNRDYTVILGTVIVYSILITLANLVVDVATGLLDPRSRKNT